MTNVALQSYKVTHKVRSLRAIKSFLSIIQVPNLNNAELYLKPYSISMTFQFNLIYHVLTLRKIKLRFRENIFGRSKLFVIKNSY